MRKSYAYTEEMRTALEAGGGLAGLQTSLKQLGAIKTVEEPIQAEASGYISYSVPCQFEIQNIILVINVDGEKKDCRNCNNTVYRRSGGRK